MILQPGLLLVTQRILDQIIGEPVELGSCSAGQPEHTRLLGPEGQE